MSSSPAKLVDPAVVASPLRRWAFRAAAVLLALAVSEAALQSATRLVPAVNKALLPQYLREKVGREPVMIADARLGWRGNPEYPGHDSRGFLNPSALNRADLVAVGDSVTYGVIGSPRLDDRTPASWQTAWPAVVGELSDQKAYNMGIGGWGPIEYLLVLDNALALQPKTIALSFFFGNDLFDCYRAVYLEGRGTDLADPALAEAAARAESEHPWYDPVTNTFTVVPSRTSEVPANDSLVHRYRVFLSNNVRLYGLARAIKDACATLAGSLTGSTHATDSDWSVAQRWAAARSERYRAFDDGYRRTIFGAPERYAVLNLDDPRIAASLSITLLVMNRFAERCRAHDIDFLVVLLPNKESVFESFVDDPAKFPQYPQMLAAERAVRAQITSHLDKHGISYVDTLEELRSSLGHGDSPYAVSADDHPNAEGYRAIASAVIGRLSGQLITRKP